MSRPWFPGRPQQPAALYILILCLHRHGLLCDRRWRLLDPDVRQRYHPAFQTSVKIELRGLWYVADLWWASRLVCPSSSTRASRLDLVSTSAPRDRCRVNFVLTL